MELRRERASEKLRARRGPLRVGVDDSGDVYVRLTNISGLRDDSGDVYVRLTNISGLRDDSGGVYVRLTNISGLPRTREEHAGGDERSESRVTAFDGLHRFDDALESKLELSARRTLGMIRARILVRLAIALQIRLLQLAELARLRKLRLTNSSGPHNFS